MRAARTAGTSAPAAATVASALIAGAMVSGVALVTRAPAYDRH